jgi:hypothetical protein
VLYARWMCFELAQHGTTNHKQVTTENLSKLPKLHFHVQYITTGAFSQDSQIGARFLHPFIGPLNSNRETQMFYCLPSWFRNLPRTIIRCSLDKHLLDHRRDVEAALHGPMVPNLYSV